MTTKPIRPNLFTTRPDGTHVLLGSRDPVTGECFWPAEAMNPRTRAPVEPAEIPGAGAVIASTTVARGLPGFASPYHLACIQLDAGPSLIAQIESPAEPGARVALEIGTIKTEKDGSAIIGPRFRTATP